MKPIDIAKRILPGYDQLPWRTRKKFLRSAAGQEFAAHVRQQEVLFLKSTEVGVFSFWFTDISEKYRGYIQQFKESAQTLLTGEHAEAFVALRVSIARQVLLQEFPILSPQHCRLILAGSSTLDDVAGLLQCDTLIIAKQQETQGCGQSHLISRLHEELAALQAQRVSLIRAWQQRIFASSEPLRRSIFKKALQQVWPDFALLSRKHRQLLLAAPLTQDYLTQWLQSDVSEVRAVLTQAWQQSFQATAQFAVLRNKLQQHKQWRATVMIQKINTYYDHLVQFFPLLQWPLESKQLSLGKILQDSLFQQGFEQEWLFDEVALNELATLALQQLFLYGFQRFMQLRMPYLKLPDNFYQQYAQKLAKAVMLQFGQHATLNLDALLNEYVTAIIAHLRQQMLWVEGVVFKPVTPGAPSSVISQSLAYLFQNRAVGAVETFVKKLSDAHAFIQYTGFSTQNESSILAILDLYNYGRHYQKIAETKTIVSSLLMPIKPLYDEYCNIGLYEKNLAWKIYRILMPLVVAVTWLVLVSILFSALSLSAFAEAAVFVLAFILSLVFSAQYCVLKNVLYRELREAFYGGHFAIPEFQVNERMVLAFSSAENARFVREFYIAEFRQCERREAYYAQLYQQGCLAETELRQRQENLHLQHSLSLEWYDIHSNYDLAYDKLKELVTNRLRQQISHHHQTLQQMVAEPEFASEIRQSLQDGLRWIFCLQPQTTAKETSLDQRISYCCRFTLFNQPDGLTYQQQLESAVVGLRTL